MMSHEFRGRPRAETRLFARSLALFLFYQICLGGCTSASASERPPVCDNGELKAAIRVIQRACNEIKCDFDKLRELEGIDKPSLMAALRDPALQPVHLFFPRNKHSIREAFDWATIKENQIGTTKYISRPRETALFVIGRASATGGADHNRRLSTKRMQSVLDFLKKDLKVDCGAFYGGYLGKEILPLGFSDARLLNIEDRDFREDTLILNQSVHVFIFPCAGEL